MAPVPQQQTTGLGREGISLVWLLQGATLAGSIGVSLALGASWWHVGPCVIAYLLISMGLDWHIWHGANRSRPAPSRSYMRHFIAAGIWVPTLIVSFALVAVILRIDWNASLVTGVLICGFIFLVAVYTFILGILARRDHAIQWFQLSVGTAAVPLLVAWLVASSFTAWVKPFFQGGMTSNIEEEERRNELEKRAKWAQHSGWRKPDGRPITVAVFLSGGGYRAATFHAGVLKALDERCIPIRYLSTVSGGSIIGAYYALGYPPDLFKQRLIDQPPELPDEMLNFTNVMLDLFVPKWNSAETYARHFDRTLFKNKTLADTGFTPQLLINATDIEGRVTDLEEPTRREVFFRDRNPLYPELNETKLAEVVAASGAFPGAFQPKALAWPSHDTNDAPRRRRFVDGGVVDNLGYGGPAHFHHVNKEGPTEDILIVSDASAETAAGALPQKVELLELLTLSQAISDETKHNLISADVISQGKGTVLRLAEAAFYQSDAKMVLGSRWYPSATDSQKISGDKIAVEVAQLPTLNELSGEQIRRASWVGYTLAQDQWTGIDILRKREGSKGPECPDR